MMRSRNIVALFCAVIFFVVSGCSTLKGGLDTVTDFASTVGEFAPLPEGTTRALNTANRSVDIADNVDSKFQNEEGVSLSSLFGDSDATLPESEAIREGWLTNAANDEDMLARQEEIAMHQYVAQYRQQNEGRSPSPAVVSAVRAKVRAAIEQDNRRHLG